jgi:hypothetical protein
MMSNMTKSPKASDDPFLERYLPELKLVAQHVPFVGAGWAQYLQDVVARRERRAGSVAAAFTEASDHPFDELLGRCAQETRLSDIVAGVLESSTRTASERKLKALGRALALGYAAADEAALDELELMLHAVENLEVAHIKVLDYLIQHGSKYDPVPDKVLATLFPNGTSVVYSVLKVLEFHGLAGPATPPDRDADKVIEWIPWDFGLLLHAELLKDDNAAAH